MDEAFILRRRKERGSAPQGCWGRDIRHQPRWRGHNGARGAGIHNTPRGIHVCGSALWKKRDSRRNEDVSVRRNELELECCRPRPRDELDPHPGTVCHRIRIRFARIRIFLSSLKIVASSLPTDLIVGENKDKTVPADKYAYEYDKYESEKLIVEFPPDQRPIW